MTRQIDTKIETKSRCCKALLERLAEDICLFRDSARSFSGSQKRFWVGVLEKVSMIFHCNWSNLLDFGVLITVMHLFWGHEPVTSTSLSLSLSLALGLSVSLPLHLSCSLNSHPTKIMIVCSALNNFAVEFARGRS